MRGERTNSKLNRILISTILALSLGLTPSCVKPELTVTYRNGQFGYYVEMPENWTIVDKPVHWITGRPLENEVGFRSEAKDIWKADWASVEVEEPSCWCNAATWGVGEYCIHRYGSKEAWLVKYKHSPIDKYWRLYIIFVHHEGKLYKVTFSSQKAMQKVKVFINGYGKVN